MASVGPLGLKDFTLTTDDDLDASEAATDKLVLVKPEDGSNITLEIVPSRGDEAYALMELELQVTGADGVTISLNVPSLGKAPGKYTPVRFTCNADCP